MLAKIITKKLNYRIINYLIDREDTVTSIARNIGSKKANVSKSLRELEEKNIVVKEIIGKSHRYSLNYLHPEAKEIIKVFLIDKGNELNNNLGCLPKFIDSYLRLALKENYKGLIIFGSALTNKYQDIDAFVLLDKIKGKEIIQETLKSINNKISPLIGTEKELQLGLDNNDSLYLNIVSGIPFGCLDKIINLRYKSNFLKRKDIEERFIIGFREIQSCKRFKDDKIYLKNHLERGVFDIVYALLSYKQATARNDREARQLFKKIYKHTIPTTLKQAELFAENMKKVIFY